MSVMFSCSEITNRPSFSLGLLAPAVEISSSFPSSSSAKDSLDVLSFFLAFFILAAEALSRMVQFMEQIEGCINARFF